MKTNTLKSRAVTATLSALFICSTMTTALAASEVTPGVFPQNAKPYGKTYGEWIQEFHRFLFSIPLDQNPFFGNDPGLALVGQSGHVSFILHSPDDPGGGEFNVTIPAGNGLFIPLALAGDGTCPGDPDYQPPPGQTREQLLIEVLDFFMDLVTVLTVEIDGVPVENPFQYRATSGLYTFDADPSYAPIFAPCGTAAGEHVDAADGYWVMLAPLSKGQHTVHWVLTLGPPVNFSGEGIYHITVE
ncbi:MAG: hypothetical protein L0Y58_13870 [Verrucomicrobia subdivision 3 bacterium]|nr:hypothetical protein [Limisphaerales bacterium]